VVAAFLAAPNQHRWADSGWRVLGPAPISARSVLGPAPISARFARCRVRQVKPAGSRLLGLACVWTITGIDIVIEIAFTERYTTQVVVVFFAAGFC